MADNKIPITRISKFFSEDDFNLHIELSKEYLHGDINMKLVLYEVDPLKTEKDDVYAEVSEDGIVFKPPVEFNGLVRVEEPNNKTYKSGMGRYLEPGNLMIHVYIKHLEELGIDIKFGDYIGYPEKNDKLRFYEVVNDGKITSDNKHNYFGYKPYYRTIMCTIVQDKQFRGI